MFQGPTPAPFLWAATRPHNLKIKPKPSARFTKFRKLRVDYPKPSAIVSKRNGREMNKIAEIQVLRVACLLNRVRCLEVACLIRYSPLGGVQTDRWIVPAALVDDTVQAFDRRMSLNNRRFPFNRIEVTGMTFGIKWLASSKPGATL